MAGKNLFEDMTSGEMRQRLQEVSEYMDEVIEERRKQLRQQSMKRDDLLEDPMWNLAHDVLEIIHCLVFGGEREAPRTTTAFEMTMQKAIRRCRPILEEMAAEQREKAYKESAAVTGEEATLVHAGKLRNLTLGVEVDTTELDEAIEKAEHLAELINENIAFDGSDLDGLSRRDTILRLVIVYGWNYGDAVDFAMNYQDSRG